jgi:hypothetical protein
LFWVHEWEKKDEEKGKEWLVNKWGTLAIAGIIGAAASAVYNYLFAPAAETTFDGSYQSRLDWALAEGEKAAALREQELRAEFEVAKRSLPVPIPPALPGDAQDSGLSKP